MGIGWTQTYFQDYWKFSINEFCDYFDGYGQNFQKSRNQVWVQPLFSQYIGAHALELNTRSESSVVLQCVPPIKNSPRKTQSVSLNLIFYILKSFRIRFSFSGSIKSEKSYWLIWNSNFWMSEKSHLEMTRGSFISSHTVKQKSSLTSTTFSKLIFGVAISRRKNPLSKCHDVSGVKSWHSTSSTGSPSTGSDVMTIQNSPRSGSVAVFNKLSSVIVNRCNSISVELHPATEKLKYSASNSSK